jgi:hypothetical protein
MSRFRVEPRVVHMKLGLGLNPGLCT